jgi:hypothetical protein
MGKSKKDRPKKFRKKMRMNFASRRRIIHRFQDYPIWKPTRFQEFLLKAAFFEEERALEAWENWKRDADIEKIDSGSQRLMPLVYNNLRNLKTDAGMLLRLKGVYKKTWFLNQLILHNAAQIAQKMREAGISFLFFKGLALILVYYPDPGLRPMTDIDVMVPWEKAELAGDLLKTLGYRFKISPAHTVFKENYMALYNGIGFVNDSGFHLDLHWSLLKHSCYPGVNDGFWARAVPVTLKGLQALVLSPEDQLLQVFEHGAYWGVVPSVRWIADALYILKGCHRFDWEYFNKLAREQCLVVPIYQMASYMKHTFGFPIPESTLSELKDHRASDFEINLYKSMIRPKNRFFIRHVRHNVQVYLRYQHYLKEYKKVKCKNPVASYVRFFQFRWSLKSVWLVPVVFPIKLFEKIWRYLAKKIFTVLC